MSLRPLDLQAERFTATGNIASEGMRNQLGRPRLDRVAVLVREAAQNSWDAKRDNVDTVHFGVSCYELGQKHLRTLREQVFVELPGDPAHGLGVVLGEATQRVGRGVGSGLHVLAIYDRGTTGLEGPTRADTSVIDGESRDFVDFLRNVGQPPDKSRGGGTFGYGKAALYLSSAVDTILVHTRCQSNGVPESRFMVSTLTNHYEVKGRGYTGRHWWGRSGAEGIVDPLLGREADDLAAALGMPLPENLELGTTILLLAPRFDERTPEQAMRYVQAQILWNFWPKMVAWDDDLAPRMSFETTLDGVALELPSPTEVPPLNGFVEALRTVRRAETSGDMKDVDVLWCRRPKRKLGLLSLRRIARQPRPEFDYGEDTELPDFVERCHHVALLRRAELVVSYYPGPCFPNDFVEFAGVFLADDDMDRIYAASEPPTHDEWRPENLADPHARTFVRVTFRKINAMTADEVAPVSTSREAEVDRPLAALANHLGELLLDTGGPMVGQGPLGWGGVPTGAGSSVANDGEAGSGRSETPDGAPPRRRNRRAKPKIELDPEVRLIEEDDTLVRLFRVDLTHTKTVRRTKLEARATIVLAGGAEERDAPEGAEQPRVAGWRGPSGVVHGPGNSVFVDEHDEGVWEIRVDGAPESLVALEVSAEEVSS